MASGAGLNRWGEYGGVPILTTSAASATSAMIAMEAIGFSKWAFQLLGTFTGYSVVIQGTIDPLAYQLWQAAMQGKSVTVGGTVYSGPALLTALPDTSWADLVAPSTEGGESGTPDAAEQFWNPLTAAGQWLYSSYPVVAVRAVATGTSQTGTLTVVGMAIP